VRRHVETVEKHRRAEWNISQLECYSYAECCVFNILTRLFDSSSFSPNLSRVAELNHVTIEILNTFQSEGWNGGVIFQSLIRNSCSCKETPGPDKSTLPLRFVKFLQTKHKHTSHWGDMSMISKGLCFHTGAVWPCIYQLHPLSSEDYIQM